VQKAFGYLRVSGRGQLRGDGFPRQLQAVQGYAKANKLQIAQVYREEGVSGKNDLEHRPALQQLLEALHSDGVRLVLVEKLDRLARDLMVQESIIADFQRSGFEIRSVAEPDLCSDDPSRTLIRQVLGAFSQYERAMIVLKLRGARQRMKAKTGRCEGRLPFGSQPGEAAIIVRMEALRAAGESYQGIADALQLEGLSPRLASVWNPIVINRILRVHRARRCQSLVMLSAM
jgi:DNA invertase Pin-like site-specific DNA recombinase